MKLEKSKLDFRFVQKEPASSTGSFDISYVYVFFIQFLDTRNKKPCRLKYIARAEIFEDVCAIKFYAARDRKGIHEKYSLAHGQMGPKAVLKIFDFCLQIMQRIMNLYPSISFVFKGAEGYDPATQKWEDEAENQRFRIYRSYLSSKIGHATFAHFEFPENSIYLLVFKGHHTNYEGEKNRIMSMLFNRFMLN